MRITLHKYIFNEIWPTFVTVLMVFIFLGISKDMLELSDFIINYGGRLTQVLMLILYLLPDILLFSLPAATLMAVFVAFLRLSSSNEILAMKSSGISLFQMLPTVLLFSIWVLSGSHGETHHSRIWGFKSLSQGLNCALRNGFFLKPLTISPFMSIAFPPVTIL
jgi:hypothetical protein